jgi:hypothetical protein
MKQTATATMEGTKKKEDHVRDEETSLKRI